MTFEFTPAKREAVGLLIGLAGGTGSGKTYSALRLASGLAAGEGFALIDTENGRGLHYADDFTFEHVPLGPPYRPEAYMEKIQALDARGAPVIVVDSASHEWAGDGGLLDWHDEEFERRGARDAVKMLAWVEPKQAHKRFVSRLLQVRAHLILAFRAEEKVEMVKGKDGRMEIVPKRSLSGLDGWIPVAEKTLPYELTLSFLLTADRPGIPKPIKLQEQHRPLVPLDAVLSEETGRRLGEWAAGDEDLAELEAELRELAARAGKAAEIEEALSKPHDGAWLREAIARAKASLAGESVGDPAVTGSAARITSEPVRSPASDESTSPGEGSGVGPVAPVPGSASADGDQAPEPSPSDGEQTKFPIPAGARQHEDQG